MLQCIAQKLLHKTEITHYFQIYGQITAERQIFASQGQGRHQVAQLSQRDRAAGWVSYGQKWKTGTGRGYFTDIIGLSSTTVT